MIKVSPKTKRLLVPIVSVIAGFLVGAIIMLAWSYNPFEAYGSMFDSALGSMNRDWGNHPQRDAFDLHRDRLPDFLSRRLLQHRSARPGASRLADRHLIGLAFKNLPGYILLPFEVIAGIVAGALVAGIAGWLRAYFGTNEVISTIMLNYIVLYLCQYLHQDVMSKNLRVDTDTTKAVGANGSMRIPWLSDMFGGSRISGGVFLALIALVIFWFLMKKTTVGFEIKAVGLNPFASRYAGMSDKKNIVVSMLLSGAFCGLGGVVQGLGTYQNYFTQTTTLDIGWDGCPLPCWAA